MENKKLKITDEINKEVEKNFYQLTEDKVKSLVVDIKNNFVCLGGYLLDLNVQSYFGKVFNFSKGRNCKNVYELAELRFNICKTTCKNIMGICKRFGHLKSVLKDEYKNYNYTQLCEMLPLTDEQLNLVDETMSAQEIRALKKVKNKSGQLTDQNIENQEISDLSALGTLKNDKARIEFLQNYKDWGVWLIVPQLNLKFYRCNLSNGAYIVVSEVEYKYHYDDQVRYSWIYCIVDNNVKSRYKNFSFYNTSTSEFLSYMKTTKCKYLIPSAMPKPPVDINKYKKLKAKVNQRNEFNKLEKRTTERIKSLKAEKTTVIQETVKSEVV